MAKQPQIDSHAPSGPRNPHTFTLAARALASLPNVVRRIRNAPVSRAVIPPKWMSRCAGVQNVSRPMVLCHEMSHSRPARMLVAPMRKSTAGQAMAEDRASTCGRGSEATEASMLPEYAVFDLSFDLLTSRLTLRRSRVTSLAPRLTFRTPRTSPPTPFLAQNCPLEALSRSFMASGDQSLDTPEVMFDFKRSKETSRTSKVTSRTSKETSRTSNDASRTSNDR